ncbi:MAG: AAA family ATPase [Candidatus Marsarchaeota archaeon]|nr:AAA family ATPase [Candidatus Marsarchaeota archaeon]MCL5094998.1 AAA family ATPase [Candidatus Marsarchaeota archaeon]
MNNKLIETGIEGLDKMLKGGIPEKNQILIAGGPGAGKTLLCFEIVYRNAKKGIPCVFISMEEQPENIIRNAKETFSSFEDIDELIANKLIIIDGQDPTSKLMDSPDAEGYSFGSIVSDIEEEISKNKAKIIVIDSLSMLSLILTDKIKYRQSLLSLISNFNRLGVTSFITYELSSGERNNLKFSKDFFLFDGVITLYQSGQEDRRMLLTEIVKMRGVNHSYALVPYEITSDGFKIYSID